MSQIAKLKVGKHIHEMVRASVVRREEQANLEKLRATAMKFFMHSPARASSVDTAPLQPEKPPAAQEALSTATITLGDVLGVEIPC